MAREFLTPILLPADPVAPMEASTRQFADEVFIGQVDPYIAEPTGKWELWIYNPPPPYLGSVDVVSLVAGATTQVTVMGQDFVAGASVATFMGVDQPNYGAGSATKMYVEITVPAGTTGDQPITVRNPDGQESSPYLIPVTAPAPPSWTVTDINPTTFSETAVPGTVTHSVNGTGFDGSHVIQIDGVDMPTSNDGSGTRLSVNWNPSVVKDYVFTVRDTVGNVLPVGGLIFTLTA